MHWHVERVETWRNDPSGIWAYALHKFIIYLLIYLLDILASCEWHDLHVGATRVAILNNLLRLNKVGDMSVRVNAANVVARSGTMARTTGNQNIAERAPFDGAVCDRHN